MKDLSFVICVESGSLEAKAALLVASIRRKSGSFSECPIVAYSPRPNRKISKPYLELMEHYSVEIRDENINRHHTDYPIANKLYAMRHAESHLGQSKLVFLDTDTLFAQEPKEFELSGKQTLSACVERTKTIAAGLSEDEYSPMWNSLFEDFGLDCQIKVRTHLSNCYVYNWWNAGVIVCRPKFGHMSQWFETFEKIDRDHKIRKEAEYFRDQIAFGIIVSKLKTAFVELPLCHNYPIQNYRYFESNGFGPELSVIWHYQPFLGKFLSSFEKEYGRLISKTDRVVFVERQLDRLLVHYPNLLGLKESSFQSLKRRISLRSRAKSFLPFLDRNRP